MNPTAPERVARVARGGGSCRATSRSDHGRGGSAIGFSLIEMLLIFAMIAIIVAIGIPALYQQMARGRLTGACEQVATHLHLARLEAMKKGFPVVVQPDYENSRLRAFLDDQNTNNSQDAGEETILDLAVPGDISQTTVYFMNPDRLVGVDSVDGLTEAGDDRVAVFRPDGSIEDIGAFRLSDGKSPDANAFEVRISPAATARIEIRKWIYGGVDGLGADVFLPAGGGTWKWY